MTDEEQVAEAREHAERVLAAETTTPTADDVHALIRRQNVTGGFGLILLVVMVGAAAWFSASANSASQATRDVNAVQLAQAERSACITERRNAELLALGDAIGALGRGQIAALIDGDPEATEQQRDLFERADAARVTAAERLRPEILNARPPEGCGPPVASIADLNG